MLELEQLREALASAKQIEAALTQRLREQELVLSGLQAVMNADNPAILMTLTFDLLREAVGFDAALVLRAEQGRFVCTDATDADAIGQSWPDGGFLRRVSDGRPAVLPANPRLPGWSAPGHAAPRGAGLYAATQEPGGRGLRDPWRAALGRRSGTELGPHT